MSIELIEQEIYLITRSREVREEVEFEVARIESGALKLLQEITIWVREVLEHVVEHFPGWLRAWRGSNRFELRVHSISIDNQTEQSLSGSHLYQHRLLVLDTLRTATLEA